MAEQEWTDEESLAVLSFHDEGLSWAEIGRRIKRTRNGVCSHYHRIIEQDRKHDPEAYAHG